MIFRKSSFDLSGKGNCLALARTWVEAKMGAFIRRATAMASLGRESIWNSCPLSFRVMLA